MRNIDLSVAAAALRRFLAGTLAAAVLSLLFVGLRSRLCTMLILSLCIILTACVKPDVDTSWYTRDVPESMRVERGCGCWWCDLSIYEQERIRRVATR